MNKFTRLSMLCITNKIKNNNFINLNRNKVNNLLLEKIYKQISCNIYVKNKDIKSIYYHEKNIYNKNEIITIIYNNNCCVTVIASSLDDIN